MQSRSRLARGSCYGTWNTRSGTFARMQVWPMLCDLKQESNRTKLGPKGLLSSLPFLVLAASLRLPLSHLVFTQMTAIAVPHDGNHVFTDRDSPFPDGKSTMTCITLNGDQHHHCCFSLLSP